MGMRKWWGQGIYDSKLEEYSDYSKRLSDLKWTIPAEKQEFMLISIVMPVFDTDERFIREAVASITSQTYQNIELIIVDDGSNNRTKQVLKSLTDSRIKLITFHKNRGIGSSLNSGFKTARGGYQTWWASDNIMEPTCIEKLAFMLNGMPRVGFVYGAFSRLDMATGKKELMSIDFMRFRKDYLLENFNLGICWMWRREVLDLAGEWDTGEWEDWDMFLRMSEITDFRFYSIGSLGVYRDHKDSNTSRLKGDGRWQEVLEVPRKIVQKRIKEPFEEKLLIEKSVEVESFLGALR